MSSRIREYPGVEVTPADVERDRFLTTAYQTKIGYSWTSGVATGRFLRGLREGELWGRRCEGCERVIVPPRMYCELCFKPTGTWVRLGDSGRVSTYSVAYVNFDASRRKDPIVIAVVELEGASPLMGILHFLGEVASERARVGMRVRAVWKDADERTGAITDIRYFRPAGRRR